MKIRNESGPTFFPCGTPLITGAYLECSPLTRKNPSLRKAFNQFSISSLIPCKHSTSKLSVGVAPYQTL